MTSYASNALGDVISRTDANTHTTAYTYDDARRLATVTSPTGQVWSYAYDPNGNVTKEVTPAGNATPGDSSDGTITFAYDVLDRLKEVDYSDSTPTVQFAYDPNGNRTSMTDGVGTETYVYDALDRLESVTRGTDVISYGYNSASQLTSRTYPGGAVTTYTYDDDGRMATAVTGGGTTTYAYNAAANLLSTTLPAGNGYVESSPRTAWSWPARSRRDRVSCGSRSRSPSRRRCSSSCGP